ncbi:hypothetical protein VQ02_27510 [Methylobacterium variabile]|jgi:Terminase large subunit, T4likevirus-type, N-terminal|uniref:Uncharacterized protein n=1 Tax=Methylobacterium variabile TaxID=298794 RepID=A0A0J6SAM0_9HYPH|nr:terminase family protein [Methylobacterium variabile]KMO30714.1 hypothetical protein VQ02_27510 [Methylobacterium variabile]
MWSPQPGPQADAISADWCPELFFGGAAGGGKSDYLLGDFLQDVNTYGAAWRGVVFRRTYPELEELLARSNELFLPEGGDWNVQKKLWTFPSGATLRMRYLESDRDATRYQGHQYTWIGWDELTQWATLFPYRYLRGRLRSAHEVPTKRIRAAANPGGSGHLEVKSYFVDPAPQGYVPILDEVTGMERMYIPSRLSDNAILVRNDPGYAGRLAGLGSEQLVKAMLGGDWSVIDGAFFGEWSSARHAVQPFAIPSDWLRFRSMDWGSAKPFSVGWWAVAGDDYRLGDDRVIPRGALIRYREWYGCIPGKPNTGLKLTAEEVAAGIVEREAGESIAYGTLDPAAFAQDGGPSIAERMRSWRGPNSRMGPIFRPADNARVARSGAMGGWDAVRARLKGIDGNPMLFVFSTCKDFIRTVPVLQHDPHRAEDLDTSAEDHVADEARYACMSRPWVAEAKPVSRQTSSGYRSARQDPPSWRIGGA